MDSSNFSVGKNNIITVVSIGRSPDVSTRGSVTIEGCKEVLSSNDSGSIISFGSNSSRNYKLG